MSRTEGIHLPRLPTSHARAVSSHAIQPHSNRSAGRRETLGEPNYTAFVGTPRQDIPSQIYHNAAMFDDVFDRQGRLFSGRNTPKVTNPLNSLQYNSLHDPHCKKLFLNNQALRNHLIQLGLLTDDLRVVSSTREQRQKIRAHELLERKEQLAQKLDERERIRLEKLQTRQNVKLPQRYQKSLQRAEESRLGWERVQKAKVEKRIQEQEVCRRREMEKKKQRKEKLKTLLEQIKLEEQTRRNEAQLQQEQAEKHVYEQKFGKTAVWHRASDCIHNRMVVLSRTKWAKSRQHQKKITLLSPEPMSPADILPVTPPSSAAAVTQPAKQDEEEDGHEETPQEKETEKELEKEDREGKGGQDMTSSQDNKQRKKEKHMTSTDIIESEKVTVDHDRYETQKAVPETVKAPAPPPAAATDREIWSQLPTKPPAAPTNETTLVQFFAELLMMGNNGLGYISFDDLYEILSSNDLALPLDHEELVTLTGNVYGTVATDIAPGMMPINQAAAVVPSQLVAIFAERMEAQLMQYGTLVEESWLQISLIAGGYMYLNKMTGSIQMERPDEYRPFLRNNPFEDIISGLFQTADANRDGYIDEADFQMFLNSPYMNERIYTEQMEEIYRYYLELATEGALNLEQFVPLAGIILQMIYSLAHPDEEWVKVELKKGKFLFNPTTGHVKVPDDKKPPPLRRRKNSRNLLEMEENEPLENEQETRKLVEEVAEKLQTDLRIIDTIFEEDEEGEGEGGEERNQEQKIEKEEETEDINQEQERIQNEEQEREEDVERRQEQKEVVTEEQQQEQEDGNDDVMKEEESDSQLKTELDALLHNVIQERNHDKEALPQ